MRKEELQEAFSQLHVSDEKLQETLMMEEKKTRSFTGKNVRYLTVCATIVVVLFTVAFLLNSSNHMGTQAYAYGASKVLDYTFFVPESEESHREPQPWEDHLSSNLGTYDSEAEKRQGVCIAWWWKDNVRNYDRALVFIDGKLIEPDFDRYTLFQIWGAAGSKGEAIFVAVEDKRRVDIFLHDDDTASAAQHLAMVLEKVEGGWNVTMAKEDMTLVESGLLEIEG